jgi:competence ComEA-like helix-hairpin-helix protein
MKAKNRIIMLVLILIIIPCFAPFAEETNEPETETTLNEEEKKIQGAAQEIQEPEWVLYEGQLNINTATVDQFTMLLGIDKLEANRIVDYRTKNGNFNATDDLIKVWGIRRLEFAKVKKYLTLEGETTLRRKKVLAPVEGRLNINTATIDQFAMLPGIDRPEAKNIVDYRTLQGKFSAVDDVLKAKGIRRLEFERFKNFLTLKGETTLKPKRTLALVRGQLNINTATVAQFSMLPSIDRFEAKNIVDYRTEKGNFNAIDDLLKVKGIRRLEYMRFKDFLTLKGETTLKKKY